MDSKTNEMHSVICSNNLANQVVRLYNIGNTIECQLITSGFNDTYLLKTQFGKFIIRVYRAGWRTTEEIYYEIEVLLNLREKGVSVSYPICKKDGNYISGIDALEGTRNVVLFTYAEGGALPIEPHVSSIYGSLAGQMHAALKDFKSDYVKQFIHIETILSQPRECLVSFLHGKESYQTYIKKLSGFILNKLNELPLKELTVGICHGDLAFYNANYEDDKITIYDFDFCGPGWVAYDLGIMRWELAREDELWSSFLASYLKENSLSEVDIKAIPLFAALRQIWLMGNSIKNTDLFGIDAIQSTIEESIRFLMRWTSDFLGI